MRAENWQDVEEKERARALHRLSKFFAIPKVSDRERGRRKTTKAQMDLMALHGIT